MPTNFRANVRTRLEALGKNRAWLGQQIGAKSAVYDWLDPDEPSDLGVSKLERILDVLTKEEKRQHKQK